MGPPHRQMTVLKSCWHRQHCGRLAVAQAKAARGKGRWPASATSTTSTTIKIGTGRRCSTFSCCDRSSVVGRARSLTNLCNMPNQHNQGNQHNQQTAGFRDGREQLVVLSGAGGVGGNLCHQHYQRTLHKQKASKSSLSQWKCVLGGSPLPASAKAQSLKPTQPEDLSCLVDGGTLSIAGREGARPQAFDSQQSAQLTRPSDHQFSV